MHRHRARSIRALAIALGRDYRRVHEDVAALVEAGLLDRDESGLHADYEAVKIETRVAPPEAPRREIRRFVMAPSIARFPGESRGPLVGSTSGAIWVPAFPTDLVRGLKAPGQRQQQCFIQRGRPPAGVELAMGAV